MGLRSTNHRTNNTSKTIPSHHHEKNTIMLVQEISELKCENDILKSENKTLRDLNNELLQYIHEQSKKQAKPPLNKSKIKFGIFDHKTQLPLPIQYSNSNEGPAGGRLEEHAICLIKSK